MLKSKKAIIIAIIVVIIVVCLGIFGIKKYNNRILDVSNTKHYVTIQDNVDFYKKTKLLNTKIHKELPIGTNVYVVENITDEEGTKWSKVIIDNKEGYVLSNGLGNYVSQDEEKVIMTDVSKFNKGRNFDSSGEFGAFMINNKISYAYVRAGGRGYGTEGNFYIDPEFETWADECEFLGIPFGIYFLDEALNSEEIDEEVDWVINFFKQKEYKNLKLPVAIDVEKHEGGRAENYWEERSELLGELVQKLEEKGLEVIVYANANIAEEFLSGVPAKFWVAYYPSGINKVPTKWYDEYLEKYNKEKYIEEDKDPEDYNINEELLSKTIAWQFTDEGAGRIIPRLIDLSIVYKKDFEK